MGMIFPMAVGCLVLGCLEYILLSYDDTITSLNNLNPISVLLKILYPPSVNPINDSF